MTSDDYKDNTFRNPPEGLELVRELLVLLRI